MKNKELAHRLDYVFLDYSDDGEVIVTRLLQALHDVQIQHYGSMSFAPSKYNGKSEYEEFTYSGVA